MRKLNKRRAIALSLALVLNAIALAAAFSVQIKDLVLYNATPSMPVGFYRRIEAPLVVGAIVTVRARDAAPDYAAARDFVDDGDRFLKRVAALAGAEVCAEGETITIEGVWVARRLERDAAGRVLPAWEGCRRLGASEVFLLGESDDSFDGRYWGPIDRSLIEGVWQSM